MITEKLTTNNDKAIYINPAHVVWVKPGDGPMETEVMFATGDRLKLHGAFHEILEAIRKARG